FQLLDDVPRRVDAVADPLAEITQSMPRRGPAIPRRTGQMAARVNRPFHVFDRGLDAGGGRLAVAGHRERDDHHRDHADKIDDGEADEKTVSERHRLPPDERPVPFYTLP